MEKGGRKCCGCWFGNLKRTVSVSFPLAPSLLLLSLSVLSRESSLHHVYCSLNDPITVNKTSN